MLRCVVVYFTLSSIAMAAITLVPLETKPEKYKDEQGCYINELDTVIPFNQSIPARKECLEYWCGEKYVSHATCGVVTIIPPCTEVEDKEKPYPDCCPRVNCLIAEDDDTPTSE